MADSQAWYIVKTQDNHCQIVTDKQLSAIAGSGSQHWGPFDSQSEAIARRVGLIRSGKCQPE
ncbi:MAG: hypothetical protein HC886_19745 [Leptolyngbyaceae cyanobacterium SM1_1_3]|nr:hypothetical protein [Leptolyngbyaceae cyanobacterium SM1_1_3]NJN04944.1 hypothetical protein [Leptolyngbyaceae cyanobacterium RM1_1_2]NJO10996.1 hypothetical protein [Leptolyngbyaceae cyanobacterium SL_1_1]